MSTDKQSADSPADQVNDCRAFAKRRGYVVVEELIAVDSGISGASRHSRPALLALMERIEEWDVLLCFDSSRLARDEEDFGWILNQLEEHGRTGFEASTGQELAAFGTRIMGVVNAEERRKIRANTHRGLLGRVERGLAAGAAPYGYRTERIGEGEGSRIVVVPEAAAVVRRIFEAYAHQGLGLRALAHQLNSEGLTSPRGNGWAPTAIREMLRNDLYRGEMVWNRSRWIKRRKGTRRRVKRPESEWKRHRDDAWRIVSDDLWSAAQATREKRNKRFQRDASGKIRRTAVGNASTRKRLLSGFLACGECGGSFHELHGRAEWGCSWHRNRGTCDNGIRVAQAQLERAVVGAVRSAIDEAVVERALEVALAELRRRANSAEPRLLEAELAALDTKVERALDLAIELGDMPAAKERLHALRVERVSLAQRLDEAHQDLPTVEELLPRLREKLRDLDVTLGADLARGRLALGSLLDGERIRVYADGRMEGLARLAAETNPAPRRTSGPGVSGVAGEGFEPPTSGL
jgi:DNA invertase Pin-like site-specific DNA recombinase